MNLERAREIRKSFYGYGGKNLVFPKNVLCGADDEAIRDLVLKLDYLGDLDRTNLMQSDSKITRKKTETDRKLLKSIIDRATLVAEECGIEDVPSLMIREEHIIVKNNKYANTEDRLIFASASHFNFIEFPYPPTSSLSDPRVARTLFHEIFHFMTVHVFQKDGDLIRKGFDYTNATIFFGNSGRGIYSEPLAELFSFFCVDSGDEKYTPSNFGDRLAFMIAFITDYSKKKKITPLDGFKKFAKAFVKGDFLFQKDLADLYGVAAISTINNIKVYNNKVKRDFLVEAAKKAGFNEEYSELQKKLDADESISFPGIKGTIKVERESE